MRVRSQHVSHSPCPNWCVCVLFNLRRRRGKKIERILFFSDFPVPLPKKTLKISNKNKAVVRKWNEWCVDVCLSINKIQNAQRIKSFLSSLPRALCLGIFFFRSPLFIYSTDLFLLCELCSVHTQPHYSDPILIFKSDHRFISLSFFSSSGAVPTIIIVEKCY